MRYYAHLGQQTVGPAAPEELLAHPGFSGETLVCPAGSQSPEDWKPAVSYPAFREKLLAPQKEVPVRCPRCLRENPSEARFCNLCGKNLDASAAEPEAAPNPGAGKLTTALTIGALIVFAGGCLALLLHSKHAAPERIAAEEAAPAVKNEISTSTIALAAPVVSSAPATIEPKPDVEEVVKEEPPKPIPAAKRVRRRRRRKTAALPPPPQIKPPTPSAPRAAPKNSDDGGEILPGVPRKKQSAGAAKSAPAASAAAAAPAPATATTPAPAPAVSTASPAAEDSAPTENEDVHQVREQVNFCRQLLAQNAYGDFFDTCLCAGSRQAKPYRGDRQAYIAAQQKNPPPTTQPKEIRVTGENAVVTVSADGGESFEKWRLEEGLWCVAR